MLGKWCFALILIIGLAVLSFASASAADVFTQTVIIEQEVKNTPSKTTYTYQLIPSVSTNPMPLDGKTAWTISGNTTETDAPSFTMEFDATQPGNYLYELKRTETTPKGDTVKPESHKFGFLVQRSEDGSGVMVIIPYTCYDNHMEIWKKTDKNGNPIGITLTNVITGSQTVTPSPSPSINPSSSPSSNNGKGQYTPKTGDETPLAVLIIVAVFSMLIVIILIIFGRRKDEHSDNS